MPPPAAGSLPPAATGEHGWCGSACSLRGPAAERGHRALGGLGNWWRFVAQSSVTQWDEGPLSPCSPTSFTKPSCLRTTYVMKEVNLRVASQVHASFLSYTGVDMATMRQVARDTALAVLEAQTAPRKPKSFSSVGNTEAFQFLGDLNLMEVVGNAVFEEELQLPDGTPTCIGFDISGYETEDAATGPLLAHHKEQLKLLGVRFGRAAFNIYDVHSLKHASLLIQHGNKAFRGIFDGCIAPYGLALTSSLMQCRIVYEHNMPEVRCNVRVLLCRADAAVEHEHVTWLEVMSCM